MILCRWMADRELCRACLERWEAVAYLVGSGAVGAYAGEVTYP
jgi:hypothetical protein